MSETITRALIREEASAQLKLRFRGTGSSSSGTGITVVEFSDLFTEALAPLAAFLSAASDPTDFRRIVTFDASTGAIVLNRASIPDGAVDAHFILTGQDWVDCINEALRTLYYTDRVEINVVSGQSLYPLQTNGAPWVHSEHQLEKIKFRWTPSGSPSWIHEQDAVILDIIEDGNNVDLLFGAMPEESDELAIFIEGRHYYEDLATESATTTCPEQLIKAATKVQALRKIWSIMGEDEAKAMFGREMEQSERELVDMKKRHIKQVEQRPFKVDRAQDGPQMAMSSEYRW